MNANIITQLSIFVNNAPGSLANVAKTLRECEINMKACNLAESTEFGILRAIVDDPAGAIEKLQKKNIIVKKTEIIGVKIKDVPGSLSSVRRTSTSNTDTPSPARTWKASSSGWTTPRRPSKPSPRPASSWSKPRRSEHG